MKTTSEWLTEKFLDWQKESGQRRSVVDFAEYLNVSQQSLSDWMNGKYNPRGKSSINKIYLKLGPEIFDVLGMDRPVYAVPQIEEKITSLAEAILKIPEKYRTESKNALMDILIAIVDRAGEDYVPRKHRLSDVSDSDLMEMVKLITNVLNFPGSTGDISLYRAVFEEKEKYNTIRKTFESLDDENNMEE